MAYAPEQPFPKTKGHVIKSKDWNDAVLEIQRLEGAKVNRSGDHVTGQLTVAGNVGVGTQTPENSENWSKVLDILGDTHAKLSVRSANIEARVMAHGGHWGAPAGMVLGTNTNHALSFGTNKVSRMTIDTAGNVGIKNTNPQRSLQIGGDVAGIGLGPSDASPNAGYIRWGDNTGWKLHFGRSREGSGGALNTGTAGVLMTLQDNGNVGIGTTGPNHRFHVLAPDAVGLFESSGTQAYLRLSTNEGINNRVELTNRPGGRLSLWTAGGGDVLNITKAGNVGIGTTGPNAKLEVVGGDMWLEGSRQFYSPGRMHIHGEEILYLLHKSGVIISRAWGGTGNLHVDGEVRLGAGDAPVHIGGNRTGIFLQLNDDLWFSDPQNGTIQIRNSANTNWGTMVGIFNNMSSAKYKKDTSILEQQDLDSLLDDALKTDVLRYRYTGDDEASRLRLGVITENCPEYLIGEDGESLSSVEYTSMLHGALKALASRVKELEAHADSET